MLIDDLIHAVNIIGNEDDIDVIVKNFRLEQEDRDNKLDQILSVHHGVIENKKVTLTHRWYDRCKPFLIQPDGNKVALLIDGTPAAEGSFLDDT